MERLDWRKAMSILECQSLVVDFSPGSDAFGDGTPKEPSGHRYPEQS